MVSCVEPMPASALSLWSKLSMAVLSELDSRTGGSGILLSPAVDIICSAMSTSILLTVL
jgi:hypothetical protein